MTVDQLALEALKTIVRGVVREELQGAVPATRGPEGFIGTAEAARRAGVKPDALLGWIAKGLIPATRPPGVKGWRLRWSDIEAFLAGSAGASSPNSPVRLDEHRARAKALADAARKGR